MKLLIAQHNLNERGGAERVILRIAQRHKAKIYTLGYEPNSTFDGFRDVDIEVFARRGPFGSLLPRVIANGVHYGANFLWLKVKEDYDVINAHMSPSEWARNMNARMLWYVHTPPREIFDARVGAVRGRPAHEKLAYGALSAVYRRVEGGIVERIEGIAANSANTSSNVRRYLHRGSEVINPGIDCKGFRNNGNGKYFLYHSRIDRMKRQEYAIDAFSRFLRMSKDKSYRLVLSGTLSKRYSDSERYYNELKSMRARNVSFVLNPAEDKARSLYSKCTALVYTPINEDFGIVPLEAMASSKPVIAVNEGGPRETVINGKTGFLADTSAELAKRMLFIAEHPGIAENMGKAGRRRAEAVYSWGRFFKGFDALARKVGKM